MRMAGATADHELEVYRSPHGRSVGGSPRAYPASSPGHAAGLSRAREGLPHWGHRRHVARDAGVVMFRSVLQKAEEDRSARASLLYLTSGIILQSVALVLSPLWTRAMSKAEYGIIAVVQPIAIFVASIVGMGLQNGVARLVHDEPRGSSAQLDVAKTIVAFQFHGLVCCLVRQPRNHSSL